MSELSNDILSFFQQQEDLYPDDFYEKSQDVNQNKSPVIPKLSDISEKQKKFEEGDEILITSGNKDAKIIFVCTRPLKQDLKTNELLSGEAGVLFDKIIKAIDLSRKDVYITSLRSVSKETELSKYSRVDLFEKLINKNEKKLIVSLGDNAGNEILNAKYNIDEIHGKIMKYMGVDFIYTYHPEIVRQNGQLKRAVWEDFKIIKEKIKN